MAKPVAGVNVPRRAFIGLVALMLLVCVAALVWDRPAAAAEGRVAELKELLTTFGGRSLDVYCADDFKEGQPSLSSVKLVGRATVLGRRFIRVRKGNGQEWLLDPERIVAIEIEQKK
jgi:hypothetical protein